MVSIEGAPQKGTVYATFIDKVVFRKYRSLKEIEELVKEDRMLELHLFDNEKEYRVLKTRKRGIQTYVISDACIHDDIYEEEIYVSADNVDKQTNLSEKICVVNYIQYDQNDMIHIVNYRLKEVD